jgi:hypothetical protein
MRRSISFILRIFFARSDPVKYWTDRSGPRPPRRAIGVVSVAADVLWQTISRAYNRANRHNVRNVLIAVTACAGLTGCYPALKVSQPNVRLIVRDAQGEPVQNATVTLATYRNTLPALYPATVATYQTDAAGKLSLRKRRTWEWQLMLPDGMVWYSWAYCIEKPGYRAVASVQPDFSKPDVVVLEQSATASRCKWRSESEWQYQVKIVEE